MTDKNRIRKGSLQIYPRVRADKIIPSVNWKPIDRKEKGFLGFLGYKVGMISVYAKDNTEHSMTKGKKITIPATIVECPSMKIYSIRFYNHGIPIKDVIVSNEKILKRRLKVAKEVKTIPEIKEFDDVRAIVYSNVKSTGIGKKKPDMIEIALSGTKEEKLNFLKEKVGKEITISEVFSKGLVDVRAVSTGYGLQGPVRRFGISLKNHKSEKGQRRPGSLSPWHPARVTFRTANAGQTGYHSRIVYNNLILQIGKTSDKDINKDSGFHKFGKIKTDYIILRGSIPCPVKRGLIMTQSFRPTKYQAKKNFEVIELR